MSSERYWIKNAEGLHLLEKLEWNFPEQKRGKVAIIGGHAGGFATEVKMAGFLSEKYKFLAEVKNFFPESLRKNFPVMPNLEFFPATESGAFKRSIELRGCLEGVDFGLFLGDFSKNSETAIAVGEAVRESEKPVILTRDTVDLLTAEMETIIERENLTIICSLAQLQKVFRAVYYPRMIMLSQPLVQVVEALHKFTLSYPLAILTLHESQILVAKGGEVFSMNLDKTDYSPITLWNGEVAAKASGLILFNPEHMVESLIAAVEQG